MTELTADTRSRVLDVLREQRIETPSWGYGNSGTRFKVFPQEGVPRPRRRRSTTPHRASVHRRGAERRPAHPVGQGRRLRRAGEVRGRPGRALGTINANVFQDNDYKLGSVTNPDPGVRRKATDHLLECIDIMDQTGSRDLKLWFSDGTNYPGQDNIRARQDRLAAALREVYDRLGDEQRLVLEYKLFEPSFYTMDVPGLGHLVRALPRARPARRRLHRHRSPRARHQHRVHRRVPAAGRQARCASTSTRASMPTTT